MTKDEALKLALEALETELCIDWTNNDEFNASAEQMHKAITAIKEALAQPKPIDDIASIVACRDALDAQPVLASFDCFMEILPESDRDLLKKLRNKNT